VANYRVLTWNVNNMGQSDYGYDIANNINRINYIAGVTAATGANVVVLQEVIDQMGEQVGFSIWEALCLEQKRRGIATDWCYLAPIPEKPQGDKECYVYFWRQGQGFGIMPNGTAIPPTGRVAWRQTANNNEQSLALAGLASNEFPDNTTDIGGRRAAWAAFQDPATSFVTLITSYHAPFTDTAPPLGLTALADMPELQSINQIETADKTKRKKVSPQAFILCGDYNIASQTGAGLQTYQNNLLTRTSTAVGTRALTSLKRRKTPVLDQNGAPSQLSSSYFANGYDNIFASDNYTPGYQAQTQDLLDMNIIQGQPASLNKYATLFGLQRWDGEVVDGEPVLGWAFSNADRIQIPLQSVFDSYILVRYAISDHVPVFLSVNIPN
jgi:hypothetical protein